MASTHNRPRRYRVRPSCRVNDRVEFPLFRAVKGMGVPAGLGGAARSFCPWLSVPSSPPLPLVPPPLAKDHASACVDNGPDSRQDEETGDGAAGEALTPSRTKADANPLDSKLGLGASMPRARPIMARLAGVPLRQARAPGGGRGARFIARRGGRPMYRLQPQASRRWAFE